MIINEFFKDKKDYKAMPMMQRMISDMIAYEANWIFADTVIGILVKQNPDYYDNADDLLRIREFQANKETSFTGKWYLTRLFESEYGEITDEVKKAIKEVAAIYANIPLVKFGWIKETANAEAKGEANE